MGTFTGPQKQIIRKLIASTLQQAGLLGRQNGRTATLLTDFVDETTMQDETVEATIAFICDPQRVQDVLETSYPTLAYVRFRASY